MKSKIMGPTAVGAFCLADDFLLAAEDTAGNRRKSTGPTRLLCYHACELYLKAYLRAHGEGFDSLRPYGHDLLALLERAAFHGLQPRSIRRQLTKANETKEYVRVRYMVGEDSFVTPLSQVMRLAKDVRECIRLALEFDEHGMPTRME